MRPTWSSAVQQAISAKAFYGCDEATVVTNSYYTKLDKELATTAGVRLVDREALQTYLDDYNQKLIEVFQAEEEEDRESLNVRQSGRPLSDKH